MDGVKSWLSKSRGSAKNLSDEGSLKSSRSVEPEAKMAAGWGRSLRPQPPVAATLPLLHLSIFFPLILPFVSVVFLPDSLPLDSHLPPVSPSILIPLSFPLSLDLLVMLKRKKGKSGRRVRRVRR